MSWQYEKRDYIGVVGHYCGILRSDWLSIPATGRPIDLRYGEAYDDLVGTGRDRLWHASAGPLASKMMWNDPSGIGTTCGLQGFVAYHQLAFRITCPKRKGGGQWDEIAQLKAKHGGGYYVRIGDGSYSLTSGWPSVFANYTGDGFLGTKPTNRAVTMRVMDFYLHHESFICKNWVPIDMLDLLSQMDVDVIGRMQSHFD